MQNNTLKAMLLTGAMAILGGTQAQALEVQDINPADVILLAGVNSSYTGEFTLPAPFTTAGWEVISARAYFKLWDAISSETWDIEFDGGDSQNGGSFGGFLTINFNPVASTTLDELNLDGGVEYTVTANSGSFILKEAGLIAQIEERSNNVPDGGATALLLGLGFAGMVGLRRKK